MLQLFLILLSFFFHRLFVTHIWCLTLLMVFVCYQRRFFVLLTVTMNSLNLDAMVMLQNPSLYSVRSIRLQKH